MSTNASAFYYPVAVLFYIISFGRIAQSQRKVNDIILHQPANVSSNRFIFQKIKFHMFYK